MEQVKEFLMQAWDFLNAPLPIVGVSIIFILIFVWKLYSSSSIGKKQLKKLNEGFQLTRDSVEETSKKVDEKLAEAEQKIKDLEALIAELIALIPNKKVQALKERLYGSEKETDSQTEKE